MWTVYNTYTCGLFTTHSYVECVQCITLWTVCVQHIYMWTVYKTTHVGCVCKKACSCKLLVVLDQLYKDLTLT